MKARVLPAALLLSACAGFAPPPSAPALATDELAVSVFLIGDAGAAYDEDEVLAELTRQARASPEKSVIVFLGDNIYPRGLPDTGSASRREMQRRLDIQVAVPRNSRRMGYFVPGNHDWARMGADGWNAILRSQAYIRETSQGWAQQSPFNGCPGPEIVDTLIGLRLVFIDTQWWLHGDHPKPRLPNSTCRARSEQEFETELTASVRGAGGRAIIVMGHHPLASAGEHGGHFTIWDHLFPLRELKKWLWVPIPLIGSIYPLARTSGISDQDMSGAENQRLRSVIEKSLKEGPALLYAAGHDHNLQIFKGPSAEFTVVSGAGYFGHVSPVGTRRDMVYRAATSGFMRLDRTRAGSIRLGVTVVEPGGSREAFAVWLKEPPED